MNHKSSTRDIPTSVNVPQHIAIIMDGNGRWAQKRFLPRVAGHGVGVKTVRRIVEACVSRGVGYLTLFAFSSENWRRPEDEVSFLMGLFVSALEKEVEKMHSNNIRLKVVGDLSRFDSRLRDLIGNAEALTGGNSGLTVTVCANYGGRWDVTQAANKCVQAALQRGEQSYQLSEEDIDRELALSYSPEPDLFIRTGGETRISNFLLWQLAYTELYFTEVFWPDFDEVELDKAIASFQRRERRFGRTSEQVQK